MSANREAAGPAGRPSPPALRSPHARRCVNPPEASIPGADRMAARRPCRHCPLLSRAPPRPHIGGQPGLRQGELADESLRFRHQRVIVHPKPGPLPCLVLQFAPTNRRCWSRKNCTAALPSAPRSSEYSLTYRSMWARTTSGFKSWAYSRQSAKAWASWA